MLKHTAIGRRRREAPLRGANTDLFPVPRTGSLQRPRSIAVPFMAWFLIAFHLKQVPFMTVRTLRTEADYKEALAEIDGIFDAKLNTPEGDRLDILALLVEAYEEQHYPIPAPDPVAALEYYMDSRGLTRRD